MDKIYVLYNENMIFIDENSQVIDKDKFKELYPAIQYDDIVVEVDSSSLVLYNAYPLHYLLSKYSIKSEDIEIQIADINNAMHIENTESDALDRIASALEYLVMVKVGKIDEL